MNATAPLSLAAAVLLLAAAPAAAQRPDTRTMTCEQARQFVRQSGAVVMTTGRHTYERIVAGQAFCDYDEETWPQIAPTRDNPRCRVGYFCRTRLYDPFESHFDRFRR